MARNSGRLVPHLPRFGSNHDASLRDSGVALCRLATTLTHPSHRPQTCTLILKTRFRRWGTIDDHSLHSPRWASHVSKYHSLWTWLFLIFGGVLLYGLFRPTPPPDVFANSDKVGHVLIFFAVSLSGRLSWVTIPDWLHWPLWALLAMALEYLQGLAQPLRIFSIEDAYANVAGVLLGLLGWLVIRLYLARFSKGAVTNVLE